MADEVPKVDAKSPSPFDVRTVKSLVALMAQHDLTEIDLRDGPQRLRLRRGHWREHGAHRPHRSACGGPVAAAARRQCQVGFAARTRLAARKKTRRDQELHRGHFLHRPNPDSPPFVRVGSKVTPETVVCIVEAMKLMNEVTADCSGTIAEILVANEQPVDYGQVLFRVDPTG